jgi:hypothetical protein
MPWGDNMNGKIDSNLSKSTSISTKIGLIIIFSIVMIVVLLPVSVFASTFSDMPNDWSRVALENAVRNGLLTGYNGKIMPKEALTRAQMVAVVNRAFGTMDKATLGYYTDVSPNAWYYSDMAKAVQMGTLVGTSGKLNPDSRITREEAIVVLARAFKLSGTSAAVLDKFKDKSQIGMWAKDSMSSLFSAGYISGSNGTLNPKNNITRAEFSHIMNKLLSRYISSSGTYSSSVNGNVMVNSPDVILTKMAVEIVLLFLSNFYPTECTPSIIRKLDFCDR